MRDDLYEHWKADERAPFAGWDFSYLQGRMVEEPPPWDYVQLARDLVQRSTAVLDLATGGGEVFATLAPFPQHAVAVEGWPPNVEVARQRLAPLGVQVVAADALTGLPFSDGSFDLITNRHGGYNVGEVHRLLCLGGQMLTQQVGGDSLLDLLAVFGARPKWPDMVLRVMRSAFERHGFTIERAEEWSGSLTFSDVGAVVYFLKAIPWLVDAFGVDRHRRELASLQERLQREGSLTFTATRYLIHARKDHERA